MRILFYNVFKFIAFIVINMFHRKQSKSRLIFSRNNYLLSFKDQYFSSFPENFFTSIILNLESNIYNIIRPSWNFTRTTFSWLPINHASLDVYILCSMAFVQYQYRKLFWLYLAHVIRDSLVRTLDSKQFDTVQHNNNEWILPRSTVPRSKGKGSKRKCRKSWRRLPAKREMQICMAFHIFDTCFC